MPLALHDVADAERFCAFIVTQSRLELSYHDREDLHAWLLSECWLLSLRFEPGGISFSTFAGNTLRRRAIDWQRSHFGRRTWRFKDRVYERPKVELVSLDATEEDRLERALTVQAGDPEADSDPAFGGLLSDGDRQRARDLDALGLSASRRVA
jgi:hypothetical protein